MWKTFDFFQCTIEFYFTELIPRIVFSQVTIATSENTILVFMSEIKFDLTLIKKIKFSVSFMLLFTIIKPLPTLRYWECQCGLVQRVQGHNIG